MAAETEEFNPADYVEYDHIAEPDSIPMKKLLPHEDDLYDGAEIKPLVGTLSDAEKMQEENIGFEYDESKPQRPELLCSDESLRKQVGAFIRKYVENRSAKTVPERRAQLLLVNNLQRFEEIAEDKLKNNFEASAVAMHLKMNENREIYRMCLSSNNKSGRFTNIYILIYPFANYYKVAVTNLAEKAEDFDNATFIYNW